LLPLLALAAGLALADDPDRPPKKTPDAAFVPTPHDVVAKMLALAAVTRDDVVYDLGCGDGRIVVAAAKAHGCRAVGVEIDKELVARARDRVKKARVEKLVTVRHGDLFEADFSDATVVTLFVSAAMARKLTPSLEKLKPGSRVVCHYFAIPGVVPDKVEKAKSEEDDTERPLYLYTTPLRREKK
jgi:protein-L-isoaspartate O-methyltransferase